jgi:acyl carrier protein
MTESDVRTTVRYWVRELAPGPEGWGTSDPVLIDDLDYHSLALLELAFALEDEFDLPPIEEEDAQNIHTAGDVEDYVVAQLRADGQLRDIEPASS